MAASFDALLNDEEKFAEKNDTLPVRLHMIWEGLTEEAFAGPRSLVDRLASRHYAGFHMTHQAVHSTHCAWCLSRTSPAWCKCSPRASVEGSWQISQADPRAGRTK